MTQERLSTGLKVNSAIDNAASYYTAQSLNNRANDLNALLDSMGQGIQTIQAANGVAISAIGICLYVPSFISISALTSGLAIR